VLFEVGFLVVWGGFILSDKGDDDGRLVLFVGSGVVCKFCRLWLPIGSVCIGTSGVEWLMIELLLDEENKDE
jgi:hypothetical protein